jgi:hypothetical protein
MVMHLYGDSFFACLINVQECRVPMGKRQKQQERIHASAQSFIKSLLT